MLIIAPILYKKYYTGRKNITNFKQNIHCTLSAVIRPNYFNVIYHVSKSDQHSGNNWD